MEVSGIDRQPQHLARLDVPGAGQTDGQFRATGSELPVDQGIGAKFLDHADAKRDHVRPSGGKLQMLGPDAEGHGTPGLGRDATVRERQAVAAVKQT